MIAKREFITKTVEMAKKTAKRTGTKDECQKPAGATYGKSLILACVIPICVVLLLFSGIIFHIYRKNKRESINDNDPDYVGSLDYYEQKYYQPAPAATTANNNPNREQYYKHTNTEESLHEMQNVPLNSDEK